MTAIIVLLLSSQLHAQSPDIESLGGLGQSIHRQMKQRPPAGQAAPGAAANAPVASDPLDARIARMTDEELLGQMLLIKLDKDILKKHEAFIKSGWLAGGLMRWDKFDAAGAKEFTAQLQRLARSSPAGLPFLVTMDHEGGPLFTQRTYGATVFPGNMALAATGDPGLAQRAAAVSAGELRALGIHVTFGPVLDINTNPDNPIIGVRAFCDQADSTAEFGRAAIRGYLQGGILPAAKHFPGHGDTGADSHDTLPCIGKSCEELERCELVPFKAAIQEKIPLMMPAHVLVPALGDSKNSVTHSAAILEGKLRRDMGFDGVIVSDSMDMGGAASAGGPVDGAARAIEAGNDLLLLGLPEDYGAFFSALLPKVKRQRLAASVKRILKLKDQVAGKAPAPEDGASLAREIARRSVTLLRNDVAMIPLKLDASRKLGVVAFRGPRFEAEIAAWTSSIASRHANTQAAVVNAFAPEFEPGRQVVAQSDVLIVATYESEKKDKTRQALADQIAFAREAAATGKPVVMISLMNPYDVAGYSSASTILCTYGITPASLDALTDVLFGAAPPAGRLPVAVSREFPRGSGL